jgi:uncharacterized protein (TIGR02594 family)
MKWFDIARKEYGVKEIDGSGESQRILEYHKTTSLSAKSETVPWCSSFVNWCITGAGMVGTNSARARSWLKWGSKTKFRKGCIVVLKRGNDPASGHVGFGVEKKLLMVKVLGGNQSNAVNEKWFPVWQVLDYRWPLNGV